MRKLSSVLLIGLLVLTLSVSAVAVTYEEAQENSELRSEYIRLLIDKYPPPIEIEIEYTGQSHEKATMAISYPFQEGLLGEEDMTLSIYSEAFEYELEDDFISTIYHEYNHVRALSRTHVLEEDNFYMEIMPEMIFLHGFEVAFNDPLTNLSWKEIHQVENYEGRFIAQMQESNVAELAIHSFIVSHVYEMLAIEEEIYRHKEELNPSPKFRDSRYQVYFNHYSMMMRFLNQLEACENLKDKLNRIFYRSWFSQKIDNYQFIKIIGGF